jgi:acetyl esterase/lipase
MPSQLSPAPGAESLAPEVEKLIADLDAQAPPADATLAEERDLERAKLDAIFTAANPEPAPAAKRTAEREVPVAGGTVAVRIHTPEGEGPFPLYLHFYGGGWAFGSHDSLVYLDECREICGKVGCAVMSVEYRRAPEFPFPTAPEDCYAALLWAVDRAGELSIDVSRVAVGGESAGGNIAAAVALMTRDRGGPTLVRQLLDIPAVDLARGTDAERYPSASCTYVIDANGLDAAAMLYVGNRREARNPYASPIFAEDLTGLAPAHVMTAELDLLRDSGEAYGRKLQAAGVPTTIARHPGHVHGSGLLLVGSWGPARAWRDEIIDVLRASFDGGAKRETEL